MNRNQIFKELERYIPHLKVIELRLAMALPGSIVICMHVNDLICSYSGKPEEEKRVSELLSSLMKIHFK